MSVTVTWVGDSLSLDSKCPAFNTYKQKSLTLTNIEKDSKPDI